MTDVVEDKDLENLDNIKEEDTEEIKTEDSGVEKVEEKKEEPKKEEVKEDGVVDFKIETREKKEEKVEYGEDIDQEDIKVIGSIVEKQTAGVKKQLQETQDRLEVEAFISERPEFAKYKPTIIKYLQHQAYNMIPFKNIASMVAANDLMKLGAIKERETQAKADATKAPGTTARKPGGTATDWLKAPKDDFESQKRRVLGQDL
jgi:hypothetical protein